jgi:hypothetical protein
MPLAFLAKLPMTIQSYSHSEVVAELSRLSGNVAAKGCAAQWVHLVPDLADFVAKVG